MSLLQGTDIYMYMLEGPRMADEKVGITNHLRFQYVVLFEAIGIFKTWILVKAKATSIYICTAKGNT